MIGISRLKNFVDPFTDRWIEVCTQKKIPFKYVDCLASDVIDQCKGLDGLLWHWHFFDYRQQLVARQIIYALEKKGTKVYPGFDSCFYYDDKIAQKYLLESINAPLVPTWVFVDKTEALEWIQKASWPKVFKLRGGAGSSNVRLVTSREQAESILRKALRGGFISTSGYFDDFRTRTKNAVKASDIWNKIKRAPASIASGIVRKRITPRERGYIYFQEFMAGNKFDTRITIIGDRIFGFVRMNRENDFRASGSGKLDSDPNKVDIRCVKIAIRVAESLGSPSMAFDFLQNDVREPVIGEINPFFLATGVTMCHGYWDKDLRWHDETSRPEDIILENFLYSIEANAK